MALEVSFSVGDVKSLYEIEPDYSKKYLEAWDRSLMTEAKLAWAGLIAGFLVALAFLAASCWMIVIDHTVPGTIIGSADVLALTALFVTRTRG